MWLEKDNNEDPYNRGNVAGKTVNAPNVGSGAGGGAPLGAGEGNQTNVTPAGNNPVAAVPQQKSATVQDYLGANKEQGNQLGQQFQSKLNDVGTKDTQAIDSAASTVKSQAQAGATAYDPTLVNKAFNAPTAVANDPNQLQSFLKQWNASYTGPASFEATDDYNKANAAATDAQTHATEVADAGGRKQILQDDFGVYGQGNKGLDHTLLQNSDNFGDVLATGKNLASLPDYLASKASDVDATATKAAADTAATKQNTQDLFQNSLTNFQTGINNKVSADQQAATSTVNQIKSDLASGDVNKINADLQKSNLSPSDRATIQDYLGKLNSIYAVKPDLNNYYTYNPNTDINKDTVASADDYAKAAALQKLTGVDYSGVLNPANVSKADTWNKSTSGFNGPSLQAYLKSSLGQQDTELMGKGGVADAAAKLGMPNLLNNPADTSSWTKFAQNIIAAAQRSGTKAGFGNAGVGHETNPLGSLVMNVSRTLTNMANNMGGHADIPQLAGIYQASEMLRQYFGNTSTSTWS